MDRRGLVLICIACILVDRSSSFLTDTGRELEVENFNDQGWSSGGDTTPAESTTQATILGFLRHDGSLDNEVLARESGEEETPEIVDSDLVLSRNFSAEENVNGKSYKFEECPPRMKEYIPCLDNKDAIARLASTEHGEKWERHCPAGKSRLCCIIPPPLGYKRPIRWPKSRDEVWYSNVPHTRLVADKGGQNWIQSQKDKFVFPGGGTQFAHGADQYLDQMAEMVPELAFGERTRVALDIGCGVASWGAYLLSRNVLTLSIAPKDVHENQIQFALERGVPAMVAVLATRRLLYPSQAFDLIHCSRCRINWTRDDGILLAEVNRIMRGGGYFAWAAQPVYKHEPSSLQAWNDMADLAKNLCWKLVAKKGYIAIWQKPVDNSCYLKRAPGTLPPLCDSSDDPDSVWYVPMKACISPLPGNGLGRNITTWPSRLSLPPERLKAVNSDALQAKPEVFLAEQRYWTAIVEGYLRGLGLKKEDIRNVMDMRAGYGGFAAALISQKVDWWVMNVVPKRGVNTLPVIYDRGLIGVAHDWCEAFDTYPRTYDLIHAAGVFMLEKNRCNAAHIILEMDRILRPGGWVLIRESRYMAAELEFLAKSVKWHTRILETESGPYGKDKLLSCQKPLPNF
ncbi:probable methyltransferase PMT11 [Selaginella moellendorffii]|uniref:probable methyltransferase PMT11 n=1 Tax=Selaginella moellendorffii TaxID=88036 RepID=UPI000D1C600B|nr:probable methyltransferase PMT11 [Selaginella moellendorffii]|eukprot:XP_024535161.1 probable methyltransferase PMT11 [Selaginella moellendorffii]